MDELIAVQAGMKFQREGVPKEDANLVRAVHGALRSRDRAAVVAWLVGDGSSVLPALVRLRSLGLLPETAMTDAVDRELLEAARGEAMVRARDVSSVLLVNAIWAKAALYVTTADEMVDATIRHSRVSARTTGLEESLLAQEMLVTAGLGQLRDGNLQKSQDLLDYLSSVHADNPARWMMLSCRVADFEVLSGAESKSSYLTGLPGSVRSSLSHDDLVDLAEANHLYGFGSSAEELRDVAIAESDPFGLQVLHVTPLRRRASYRTYRVARLVTALGAKALPWMSAPPSGETPVSAAYARAILSAALFDGLLWAGYRPPVVRLSEVWDSVVVFLRTVEHPDFDGSVELAAGVELISRLLGFAQRLDNAPHAISAVASALLDWIVGCIGRKPAIAVEAAHAITPCRDSLGNDVRNNLDLVLEELREEAPWGTPSRRIAVMEALDAMDDGERCWQHLQKLG